MSNRQLSERDICTKFITPAFPQRAWSAVFSPAPVDKLADLKVGCRLRRQTPIGLGRSTLTHLRITTVIPQRRPACRDLCGGSESAPM